MRRYRRRKFWGKLVVPVEIDRQDVAALIYNQLLDPKHKGDRAEIGRAVVRAWRYGGDE
jgi:hypothetical protein